MGNAASNVVSCCLAKDKEDSGETTKKPPPPPKGNSDHSRSGKRHYTRFHSIVEDIPPSDDDAAGEEDAPVVRKKMVRSLSVLLSDYHGLDGFLADDEEWDEETFSRRLAKCEEKVLGAVLDGSDEVRLQALEDKFSMDGRSSKTFPERLEGVENKCGIEAAVTTGRAAAAAVPRLDLRKAQQASQDGDGDASPIRVRLSDGLDGFVTPVASFEEASFELPEERLNVAMPAGRRLRMATMVLEGGLEEDEPPLDFNGCWKCIDTTGLDGFLRAIGASWLDRSAGARAPWPSWEFHQAGNTFTYVNHTAFGTMTEEFTADGKPYKQKALRDTVQDCKAFWENGILVIVRSGKQGKDVRQWRETRNIVNGILIFEFHMEEPQCSWGRKFEKKIVKD